MPPTDLESSWHPALREYWEAASAAFHGLTKAGNEDPVATMLPHPMGDPYAGVPSLFESPRTRALRDWESLYTPALREARPKLDKAALACGSYLAVGPRADRFEAALAEAHRVMDATAHKGPDRDPAVGLLISTAFDRLHDLEQCGPLLVAADVDQSNTSPAIESLLAKFKVLESQSRPRKQPSEAYLRFRDKVEAAELTALIQLGEREVWDVGDLPAGIDVDMLRCLDEDRLVEACLFTFEEPTPEQVERGLISAGSFGDWFSPMRTTEPYSDWTAVTWCRLVPPNERNRKRLYHVRLSDHGRVVLARMLRSAEAKTTSPAEAEGTQAKQTASGGELPGEIHTGPSLTAPLSRVLRAMAIFDGSLLLSVEAIAKETANPNSAPPLPALSDETVRKCVAHLIRMDLAERPEGNRRGARLNIAGRKLSVKIAD